MTVRRGPRHDTGGGDTLLHVMERLRERVREAERRRAEEEALRVARNAKANRALQSTTPTQRSARGRSSSALIEEAQLSLFQLEQSGHFAGRTLLPESEYPTLLTRLPIFAPGNRSTQRRLLDQDNALLFTTPWGAGKKHGPPLSVYDEDTLIAIGRLRQRLLVGRPQNLPLPVSAVYKERGSDNVHVHVLYCMLTDIVKACGGASDGGRNYKLRLDSIKRLAATVIEFSTKTADRYMGRGTAVKLIDVAWQEYEQNAILYIQFSPVMAAWFEREYTYIDWNLRRKLPDVGKAIHRFLASQPREYEIYTKKLMQTIGYMREYKKFMADLRGVMKQLKELGWVKDYRIEGSGRRKPHKLVVKREKRKKVSR